MNETIQNKDSQKSGLGSLLALSWPLLGSLWGTPGPAFGAQDPSKIDVAQPPVAQKPPKRAPEGSRTLKGHVFP